MRIAELSRRTGVPVPRIKYYIREGLVDHGELTHANQATYGERHVRQLRLVRALVTIGGLSIADARAVLDHLDEPGASVDNVLGYTMAAIARARRGAAPARDDDRTRSARRYLEDLIARRGWRYIPESPAMQPIVEVIAALHDLGLEHLLDNMDAYAAAAEQVAASELESVDRGDPQAILESAVVGTVLGEALYAGLRRLAHIDASAKRFLSRPARADD